MIAIVDYGVGNFGSVSNMLRVAGFSSLVTQSKDEILVAEKIILPGIGAFDTAMQRLSDLGLIDPILRKAEQGTPTLGICLGAQLLSQRSDEGILPGLGLLPAACVKFEHSQIAPLKVPHMGWDEIEIRFHHPIVDFQPVNGRPKFYFSHSYFLRASDPRTVLATSVYGHSFDCVLAKENIVAAQFHPEKSHKFGLRLLSNFAQWRYEKG